MEGTVERELSGLKEALILKGLRLKSFTIATLKRLSERSPDLEGITTKK